MANSDIKFRKIFVVEPSHDVSALKAHTDEIIMMTTGYEDMQTLPAKITGSLRDFDPELDAIIPVGKIIASFVSGVVLARMGQAPIWIGVYKDKRYTFLQVGDTDAS